MAQQKKSDVERIKENSRLLRGTLQESLDNPVTGAFAPDDTQLIKFHGFYQQTDRALDSERKLQKLEPLFSFMLRIRVPGGVLTPWQWLRLDALSEQYGNHTMKLTTRQAIQLHGVRKRHLKTVIRGFNAVQMDSIAGCGDVNRNVMAPVNSALSEHHAEVYADAAAISRHFTPATGAYWEIWMEHADGSAEQLKTQEETEPIYGPTYLPRKFKIALAIPPHNETDLFANDVALVAIVENGVLTGYNVAVGGGMGMTFGVPESYPRLADPIGFVPKAGLMPVLEAVLTTQRDWGNREDRRFSRLKYTIDRVGLPAFKAEVEKRAGFALQAAKPYLFERSGDQFGWSANTDGTHNLLLFVEGGRIADARGIMLKTALREIAAFHGGDFRLTGSQNLLIGGIIAEHRPVVQRILTEKNVWPGQATSAMRQLSVACVALNTCSLAFAEAERYLPGLIDRIEPILEANGLRQDEILIRMTGCPNGCGRPYLGEIGLVGKAAGKYNLYLGAAFNGERLNKLYREMLDEAGIIRELSPLLESYARERNAGERFGDFCIRQGWVTAISHGTNFHT